MKKEAFLDYKKCRFLSPQNCIFPKGLTDDFGQKTRIFPLFVFG